MLVIIPLVPGTVTDLHPAEAIPVNTRNVAYITPTTYQGQGATRWHLDVGSKGAVFTSSLDMDQATGLLRQVGAMPDEVAL